MLEEMEVAFPVATIAPGAKQVLYGEGLEASVTRGLCESGWLRGESDSKGRSKTLAYSAETQKSSELRVMRFVGHPDSYAAGGHSMRELPVCEGSKSSYVVEAGRWNAPFDADYRMRYGTQGELNFLDPKFETEALRPQALWNEWPRKTQEFPPGGQVLRAYEDGCKVENVVNMRKSAEAAAVSFPMQQNLQLQAERVSVRGADISKLTQANRTKVAKAMEDAWGNSTKNVKPKNPKVNAKIAEVFRSASFQLEQKYEVPANFEIITNTKRDN